MDYRTLRHEQLWKGTICHSAMKRFQPRGDRRLGKQDQRQLHVLYEDDAVVVLNKRANLLAVPKDDSDTPRVPLPKPQIGEAPSIRLLKDGP